MFAAAFAALVHDLLPSLFEVGDALVDVERLDGTIQARLPRTSGRRSRSGSGSALHRNRLVIVRIRVVERVGVDGRCSKLAAGSTSPRCVRWWHPGTESHTFTWLEPVEFALEVLGLRAASCPVML